MRPSIACLFLCGLCLLVGCGDPSLYVTLDGEFPKGASSLRVRTLVNDRPGVDSVEQGRTQFIVKLPPDASGRVHLEVTALDAKGCSLGMGGLRADVPTGLRRYSEHTVTIFPWNADGFAWCNPLPQGNQLSRVWGSAADDVWAVGQAGTIMHWDGGFWTPRASGRPTTFFSSIWGSGPDDVWLTLGKDFLHWDGSSLIAVSSSQAYTLRSIWGSGPSDIWAVGDSGTAAHYDGVRWSEQRPSAAMANLQAVWSSGPGDVWTVGDGGILSHFDGNAWTNPISPSSQDLRAIWGTGPNDVWAAGEMGALLHFNGQWSVVPTGVTGTLLGLWGSSPNDVWAVGPSSMGHWDGTRWSFTTPPVSQRYLPVSIWGSGPSDVWGTGYGGLIQHFDGSQWSELSSAVTRYDLLKVQGSGPDDIWAVGSGRRAVHWDGQQWIDRTLNKDNNSSSYIAVGVSSARDVRFVDDNTVSAWNGTQIESRSAALAGKIEAAWMNAPSDIWAVGGDGSGNSSIWRWIGTQWTTLPGAGPGALYGVWSNPQNGNDAWAVGGTGKIVHWNGTQWTSVTTTGTTQILYAVAGSDANNVWTVGTNGTMVKRVNATQWTPDSYPTTQTFYGVFTSGPSDVWAVGGGGLLRHLEGTNRSILSSGTTLDLKGVWSTGHGDVWVVGNYGVILHRGAAR